MEECFICFEETDHFVEFECSHKVCTTCFPKLRSPLCPICSRAIKPPEIQHVNVHRVGSCMILGAIIAILLWAKRDVIF
jgi:hypothetical protein